MIAAIQAGAMDERRLHIFADIVEAVVMRVG